MYLFFDSATARLHRVVKKLKKDWFSEQKIIYTATLQIMPVTKEFWKMLLLLSSAV